MSSPSARSDEIWAIIKKTDAPSDPLYTVDKIDYLNSCY